MMRRPLKKTSNGDSDTSYWISFSDLMSGVLIIFMLLFVHKLLDYQTSIESKEKLISDLSSKRIEIISLLQEEFKKENLNIFIDSKTGAIILDESILFDSGKSELKEEGKVFIEKFIPIYTKILLGKEEIKGQLSEIIVEGHTDDTGNYIYNMELSQARSFNVLKYTVDGNFDYEFKEELKNYVAANGKSFSDLKKNEDGTVNKDASRRVEIKFRLNEEEALFKIKEELDKGV